MIFFTISGLFKALIAFLVMLNRFGPSSILLDLENRVISQLKTNQKNMCCLLDMSSPYGCTHGVWKGCRLKWLHFICSDKWTEEEIRIAWMFSAHFISDTRLLASYIDVSWFISFIKATTCQSSLKLGFTI